MIEQERAQTVDIACKRASEKGWAVNEPLDITVRRGRLGGITRFVIETNAGKKELKCVLLSMLTTDKLSRMVVFRVNLK